jgi:hypothetical protein
MMLRDQIFKSFFVVNPILSYTIRAMFSYTTIVLREKDRMMIIMTMCATDLLLMFLQIVIVRYRLLRFGDSNNPSFLLLGYFRPRSFNHVFLLLCTKVLQVGIQQSKFIPLRFTLKGETITKHDNVSLAFDATVYPLLLVNSSSGQRILRN